jgi:hypothetical protein
MEFTFNKKKHKKRPYTPSPQRKRITTDKRAQSLEDNTSQTVNRSIDAAQSHKSCPLLEHKIVNVF